MSLNKWQDQTWINPSFFVLASLLSHQTFSPKCVQCDKADSPVTQELSTDIKLCRDDTDFHRMSGSKKGHSLTVVESETAITLKLNT